MGDGLGSIRMGDFDRSSVNRGVLSGTRDGEDASGRSGRFGGEIGEVIESAKSLDAQEGKLNGVGSALESVSIAAIGDDIDGARNKKGKASGLLPALINSGAKRVGNVFLAKT